MSTSVEWMDMVRVFVTGGLICTVGQVLLDTTKLTAPRILVLFVIISGVLTALGFYQPFVEYAGCGATVPITGFGYALVKGAITETVQSGLMGAFTGGLKATAAGITAALTVGYLIALCARPKTKAK